MGPVDEPRPEAETSGCDPTPEPTSATTLPPTPDPVIASIVSIPAQESSDQEGGEWDLLVGKVKAWLEKNDPGELWSKSQLPLRVVAGLIVLILVAKVYYGVLKTIESIPLVPGLLEFLSLIWLANFALRNLIRNSDRNKFIESVRSTWSSVTGRSS